MYQIYHSNGKFLLTSEYLVLHGALALALPLKLGQSIEIETFDSYKNRLIWEAFRPDGKWFSVTLNRDNLVNFSTNDPDKALRLSEILQAVKQLNPKAFEGNDLRFTTRLDFDPNWGLGSSSTLIASLARWANVNPYELLKLTFGGSGYDIACASAEGPIYYQLAGLDGFVPRNDAKQEPKLTPLVDPVVFNPTFADHLFFVYQGQKQSSSKEIKAFLAKVHPDDLQKDIEAVSEISRAVPKCQNIGEFSMLMQCHERIIARCICQEPVQKRFPDFEGTLKSLGAWGGDFILAATEWDESQVRAYFKTKGLEVFFGYKDIVK
jgi:mevalonate kinase